MVSLSHLLFADDAVFVGSWSEANINTLVNVLDCFRRASGLKINMCKSKIMGVLVDSVKVNQAASKLGCLTLQTPFKYLGTLVGGVMSRVNAWKEVINSVKARLSKWKMKTLSIGGRFTLLKSVLGSLPIYHMSIYRVPIGVLQELESIRSHFFNGNDISGRKASWVRWSNVLTAKAKGGLGVASLYALNRGLMLKWMWRFYTEKNSLWVRVVKAIHGNDGGVGRNIVTGTRSCWLTIVKEARLLKEQGIDFFEFCKLRVGDGSATVFWDDCWKDDRPLKAVFPRLYALELRKDICVKDKLSDPSIDFSFRRRTRGGEEQTQLDNLLESIGEVTLLPKADRFVWSLNNSQVYSVASMRSAIDDTRSSSISTVTRWIKIMTIKIKIFERKVKMNALPSRFNISRRGIDIASLSCPLCDNGIETTNHLFFNCYLAKELIDKIVRWWNISYGNISSYDDWLAWVSALTVPSNLKLILEGVFYVMWWFIWSFRNRTLFDTKVPLKATLFDDIVSCSFNWCKFRYKASFSWNDWLKTPYLIVV